MRIWTLAVMLILLAPAVLAQDIMGADCSNAYIFEPGAQVKCEVETKYIAWSEILIGSNDFVMEGVKKSTEGYREVTKENSELVAIKNSMLVIAVALAALVLTYGGYLWIISATDAKVRHAAKRQLMGALYMLIFVNAAFFLGGVVFDLSVEVASYLESNTQDFFNQEPWMDIKNANRGTDVEGSFNRFKELVIVSPMLIFSGWLYMATMYLRNIVVLLLLALAPIVVVLFFFRPSRPWGTLLIILFGVELFMPVLFFPMFKIASIMFSSNSKLNIIIISASLLIAVFLHLAVVGVAIFKSAGLFHPED